MNPFLVAKNLSRPLVLAALAFVLAWAGASPATAEEPVPSPERLEMLLFTDGDCQQPAAAGELPELFPAGQPMTDDPVNCSPYCGYVGCRGVLTGEACTTSTGAPGTCYGPTMGKKCVDGRPMCLCVA